MSNYGPVSAFVIVGGRDLTSDSFVLTDEIENLVEETHSLGKSWEESKPIQLARVTLEANGGLYDDRQDGMVNAIQGQGGTQQNVLYGMNGTSIGAEISMLEGALAMIWKRIVSRTNLTKANGVYKVTGRYDRGRLLHGPTAEGGATGNTQGANAVDQNTTQRLPVVSITSSNAGNDRITSATPHGLIATDVVIITGHTGSTPSLNGTQTVATVPSTTEFTVGIDITVGGTGGTFVKVTSPSGRADLHVLALTLGGYTNVTVKVRHSTDNSTYSDLATFANVTGVGSQRVAIAVQIQRYTAMNWTFNGAGSGQSITPVVALARD